MNTNELTLEQRKKFGIRKLREQALRQDDIRGFALAAMYPLRDLTQSERKRVIRQMSKMNEV